jgi:maleate isomerase
MADPVKMGVIFPSTNTVVEPDYEMLRPDSASFHIGRAALREPDIGSVPTFKEILDEIDRGTEIAIRDVVSCKPDYMIMAMSLEAFWGGKKGCDEFIEEQKRRSGLDVTAGPVATRRLLREMGAESIAFLAPYPPEGNAHVRAFYEESGFNVVADEPLSAPTATAMAEISEKTLAETLQKLDSPDVDVLLQCGTNVSMVRLADAAERWFGKPVIAINAACVWDALRTNGINDRYENFGTLFRDY